jgi:hypothetical protein
MRTDRSRHVLAGTINHLGCSGSTYFFHTLAARNADDMRSAIG